MQSIITENRERIGELCRQHHVRRLSVFGSTVRDDFDPERSHVDLIVDFRNRIVHEYFTINNVLIYSNAKRDLPPRMAEIKALLSELPS